MIQWEGKPLWERQSGLSRQCTKLVAVSARKRPEWLANSGVFLADAPNVEGPLAGLISGLECAAASGSSHALFVAVDLPCLKETILRNFWELCEPGLGIIPHGPKGFEPLAAIYSVEALPYLLKRAAKKEWRLQDAVAESIRCGCFRRLELDGDHASEFANINTPEDLRGHCS